MAYFQLLNCPERGRVLTLQDGELLGTGPNCTHSLQPSGPDRLLARVRNDGSDWWLEVLLAGGLRSHGQPSDLLELQTQEEVTVPELELILKFWLQAPPSIPRGEEARPKPEQPQAPQLQPPQLQPPQPPEASRTPPDELPRLGLPSTRPSEASGQASTPGMVVGQRPSGSGRLQRAAISPASNPYGGWGEPISGPPASSPLTGHAMVEPSRSLPPSQGPLQPQPPPLQRPPLQSLPQSLPQLLPQSLPQLLPPSPLPVEPITDPLQLRPRLAPSSSAPPVLDATAWLPSLAPEPATLMDQPPPDGDASAQVDPTFEVPPTLVLPSTGRSAQGGPAPERWGDAALGLLTDGLTPAPALVPPHTPMAESAPAPTPEPPALPRVPSHASPQERPGEPSYWHTGPPSELEPRAVEPPMVMTLIRPGEERRVSRVARPATPLNLPVMLGGGLLIVGILAGLWWL